jgi:hypothetical protein
MRPRKILRQYHTVDSDRKISDLFRALASVAFMTGGDAERSERHHSQHT